MQQALDILATIRVREVRKTQRYSKSWSSVSQASVSGLLGLLARISVIVISCDMRGPTHNVLRNG